MMRRINLGALAYVVPTFVLGFVWHLVAFKTYYDALAIYRAGVIIPFGFVAMLIQAFFFAWVFESTLSRTRLSVGRRGLYFAALGAVLSWSYTTLSVAAKNVMTSVPDYLLIESAFTVVQWIIVGPLMALLLARGHAPVARVASEA
jgi:hypothetical protein